MAIASLVLGILGMCGITALVGLILGIVSLVKINKSGGRLSGQGLAIAGICVSGFMLLFSIPFMAGMTLPALARAKQKAMTINCMNNMKQLGLAVRTYAVDHNGQLPPAATWCDAIQSRVGSPKVFQCPSEPERRCSYAFNAKLDGKKDSEINPQTVLLFESDAGWNGTGDADNLKPHSHSGRIVIVALADGAVMQIPRFEARHPALGAVTEKASLRVTIHPQSLSPGLCIRSLEKTVSNTARSRQSNCGAGLPTTGRMPKPLCNLRAPRTGNPSVSLAEFAADLKPPVSATTPPTITRASLRAVAARVKQDPCRRLWHPARLARYPQIHSRL